MNSDQIRLLEETLHHKNSKVPVAFIAADPSSRKVWTPVYQQKPSHPLQSSGLLGPVRVDVE